MTDQFVFVRKRTVQLKEMSKTFLEFFVELLELQDPTSPESKYVFQWPSNPGRFEKRIAKALFHVDSFKVFLVHSEAPPQIQKRTLENFKTGAWITQNDAAPKGGLPNVGVPDLATLYGIHIDYKVTHFLRDLTGFAKKVYQAAELNFLDDPMVVYHGTSKANVKNIVTDSIKPSQGMFGTCVYFGNFWKAYRFAVMDQDFTAREGGIFRVYAFWNRLALRTPACKPCQCAMCSKAAQQFGPQSVSQLSDHLATWIKEGDAVQTPILWNAHTSKYQCKSEEQASLNVSKIQIESVGFVQATKDYIENRDPLDRNLKLV